MASGLPELAISAVEDVAADSHNTKVLLDDVSELLLCVALPKRRQLRLHAVTYAVTEYFVILIHPIRSFFFATPSLPGGLYFGLRLLADVHDAEVIVRGLELPRYREFLVRTGVDTAA